VAVVGLSSANAVAAPRALYNPATGGVTFVDLGLSRTVSLFAIPGPLIPANAIGATEIFTDHGGAEIIWNNQTVPFGSDFFGGNVVPPGKPVSQLFFGWNAGQREMQPGAIVEIPEPAAWTLLGVGLLAVIAHRRRPA
jgi:hypothetical protein